MKIESQRLAHVGIAGARGLNKTIYLKATPQIAYFYTPPVSLKEPRELSHLQYGIKYRNLINSNLNDDACIIPLIQVNPELKKVKRFPR